MVYFSEELLIWVTFTAIVLLWKLITREARSKNRNASV